MMSIGYGPSRYGEPVRPPSRRPGLIFGLVLVAVMALTGAAAAQSSSGLSLGATVRGDVGAKAGCGTTASNRIAHTDGYSGGGRSNVTIDGDVTTLSGCGQRADTVVGTPSQSGDTVLRGDVTNLGGSQRITGNTTAAGDLTTMPGTELKLGGCGSTTVIGDVFVGQGDLEIGCVCAGRRNGQCCIAFHHATCVLAQQPPSDHGCPPGYILSEGLCRLYSDFSHAYGR